MWLCEAIVGVTPATIKNHRDKLIMTTPNQLVSRSGFYHQLTAAICGVVLCSVTTSLALNLNPLADTYVQISSSADNSAATQMLVKNQGNNANERISFLRFDGTGIGGGMVDTASLSLRIVSFANKANMTLQLFGIPEGAFNEAFTAGSLTYTNSGYTTATEPDNNVVDALLYGGVPLATFALVNTANVGDTINFSGAGLVSFLNANNNGHLSFVITTSTIHDQVFLGLGTAEYSGNAPVLEYALVPEPSSLTLAVLGGFGLALWRQRYTNV
jgi:hypothetical protein